MVTRRSQKRPVPCEKDQAGCIWGLVSIFDFRYGRSTRRLLSYRRRGSKHDAVSLGVRYPGDKLKMLTNSNEKSQKKSQDSEESDMSTANVIKTSMKELIDEEMFCERVSKKHTNSAQVELEQFESESADQLNKNPNRNLDAGTKVGPENSCRQVIEQKISNNIDLDIIMEELCRIHQKNTSSCVKCDWPDDLEDDLRKAIKVFINQRITNGNSLTEDEKMHHSEELINALETLSLNKELFLELVKDPNSPLVGPNLLVAEPSNSRPLDNINYKHHSFFRRKSKESNPLKGNDKSQPKDRIVILKPGPAGNQNLNTSQFSFTEIKRKLKHAMGKERDGIVRNGIAHKFPFDDKKLSGMSENGDVEENMGWGSPNRNHFYTERFAIKRTDKNGKLRESKTKLLNETTGYPEQGVLKINVEAKKHISDMLSNGDKTELKSGILPKTLGRILSLPEYDFSPRGNSHVVNKDMWQVTNELIHPSPLMEESKSPSEVIDDNPDENIQSPNSHRDVSDELNQGDLVQETRSSMRDEGVVESLKTAEIEYQQESEIMDVLCEESSSLISRDVQSCDIAEVCNEEIPSQCLKLDSFDEDPSFSSPAPWSSSLIKKIDNLESAIDRTERPSPISVLEPLFTEDDISPTSTTSRPVEKTIQPLQIHFDGHLCSSNEQEVHTRTCMEDEESAFEYVEAVLLGSGLNWEEYLTSWLCSDPLLHPSLFDEVELYSNRSCHEQKLLFDCTNDVLKELCERYFGCSFVERNVRPVPKRMKLIYEVWEGVEWHLLKQPSPHSLDLLLKKDMEKSGGWMDIQSAAENIAIDLRNFILEDLLEDTILSFVNNGVDREFSALWIELCGDETSEDS